jgi:pimeloyl-ACP methyl ester carboxylesterase
MRALLVLLSFLCCPAFAQQWRDLSPHRVRTLQVATGSRLEVLDWGGRGRPIVLLAGLGSTAHVFDEFAPNLRKCGRVYAITRRGFGASPPTGAGYTTAELANDVLGVITALGLEKPVVIGHSIAGLELSALGANYRDRLGGLIYLDPTILHDDTEQELLGVAPWGTHLDQLRQTLSALENEQFDTTPHVRRLIDESWPALQADLQLLLRSQQAIPAFEVPTTQDQAGYAAMSDWYARSRRIRMPQSDLRATLDFDSATGRLTRQRTPTAVFDRIQAGKQRNSPIDVPSLAIFALRDTPRTDADPESAAALTDVWSLRTQRRVEALERDVTNLQVVLVKRAEHAVFLSNPQEVLDAIYAFLAPQLRRDRW